MVKSRRAPPLRLRPLRRLLRLLTVRAAVAAVAPPSAPQLKLTDRQPRTGPRARPSTGRHATGVISSKQLRRRHTLLATPREFLVASTQRLTSPQLLPTTLRSTPTCTHATLSRQRCRQAPPLQLCRVCTACMVRAHHTPTLSAARAPDPHSPWTHTTKRPAAKLDSTRLLALPRQRRLQRLLSRLRRAQGTSVAAPAVAATTG